MLPPRELARGLCLNAVKVWSRHLWKSSVTPLDKEWFIVSYKTHSNPFQWQLVFKEFLNCFSLWVKHSKLYLRNLAWVETHFMPDWPFLKPLLILILQGLIDFMAKIHTVQRSRDYLVNVDWRINLQLDPIMFHFAWQRKWNKWPKKRMWEWWENRAWSQVNVELNTEHMKYTGPRSLYGQDLAQPG